jgi:uncharacterized protein (TIGR03435 family)
MTTTHRSPSSLCGRLQLTLTAATIAFTAPFAFAQSTPPVPTTSAGAPLAFSAVSVLPHGNAPAGGEGCNADACHFIDVPLRVLVYAAYNLSDEFIFGGPPWVSDDRFDLDAKIDPADMPAIPPTRLQLFAMLQPVLADRFKLRVHHETRPFPAYDLVLAKGGSKLKSSTVPPVGPCRVKSRSDGTLSLRNCWMAGIAHFLLNPSGRQVVDKTGLTGRYDVDFHWTPDNAPADSPLAGGPSIFTAIQEQLGLKLMPSTAPLDVLVIDSAEKPRAN